MYGIEFQLIYAPEWYWVKNADGSRNEWANREDAETVAALSLSVDPKVRDVRVIDLIELALFDGVEAASDQPHEFTGERGQYLDVLSLRQVYDAVLTVMEAASVDPDPGFVARKVCCELEKQLGIYPNVRR